VTEDDVAHLVKTAVERPTCADLRGEVHRVDGGESPPMTRAIPAAADAPVDAAPGELGLEGLAQRQVAVFRITLRW
jgi:hypothetical protein